MRTKYCSSGRVGLNLLLTGLASVSTPIPAEADPQDTNPASWDHVQVIAYASGLTGFFDARSGILYLYDANLENPVIVRRVSELGSPLEKITR